MRQFITSLFLVIFVCSCATRKPLPTIVTTQDSTRTEVRYEVIERIDTVFVSLPNQTSQRLTQDTTSTLETAYAQSTAKILPNGLLYHDITTKPHPVPVPVKHTAQKRDSIVERKVEIPVPYPVVQEVNRITWFQQAQIYGCRTLVAMLAIFAIVRYRKKIFVFIRRIL